MASKADWLRNKRIKQRINAGRPRKEGQRYPSGDIKRSETEKEVKSVATAAARRVHGLSVDANGRHGYTLGRMHLDGRISDDELEAGNWYAGALSRYYGMSGVPFPSARAQDLFKVKGEPGNETDSRVDAIRKATNMFMKLEGALLKCADGPHVKSTVYNVCFMDIEGLRMMPQHQLEWLRRGLREVMLVRGIATMSKIG